MVRQPANHSGVAEQLRDIAARERQVEIVDAVAVFYRLHLRLESGKLPFHPGDLLARRTCEIVLPRLLRWRCQLILRRGREERACKDQ